MTELTELFLEIGKILALLIILLVLFLPEGIFPNDLNFQAYAEPLTLESWIVTTMSSADQVRGEFSSSFSQSGNPAIITVYKEGGDTYVNVTPMKKPFMQGSLLSVEPKKIITSCEVKEQTFNLEQTLFREITIRKSLEDGLCKIEMIV